MRQYDQGDLSKRAPIYHFTLASVEAKPESGASYKFIPRIANQLHFLTFSYMFILPRYELVRCFFRGYECVKEGRVSGG